MKTRKSHIDLGILIRRSLFFQVLLLLTLANLFVMFRGLNSPQAMDQAQISREIARGNGATTKFIRPADYYLAQNNEDGAVSLKGFEDSYHAPLNLWVNAIVFKIVGAEDPNAYAMGKNQIVFQLDRVVVTVSTIFFLLAIGVNYLLITRIFDAKLAGVCAIIMLSSQTFWLFSLSGLPQMLMLFLFSCGAYFTYRAIEGVNHDKAVLRPALLAGLFFTLLAMTHWVTIWIALGYVLFAAIAFRPRGVVGFLVLLMLALAGAFTIVHNFEVSGKPFGTAFLTLYNGLANGTEASVMRTFDLDATPLAIRGLTSKVLRAILVQTSEIVPLLAGIIVAPVFFLSLLHRFKSKSIGMLRWALFSMWLTGALGLAFFGISDKKLDPNQTHLLFAPLMTAYGVAFISILWTRLSLVGEVPVLRNAHLIVICVLCAAPLALDLPRQFRLGMNHREKGGVPHWPPYYAPALHNLEGGLRGLVNSNEVVFSDQPWAVAWYADRISIWLPPTKNDFIKLETVARQAETPSAGILISPSSHGMQPVNQTVELYRDFAALVLNGGAIRATVPNPATLHDKANVIREVTANYPSIIPLIGVDMIFYTDRQKNTSNP